MSRNKHTTSARETYFHPDDPAGWLKPDEPFIVDGLDWSWAFVVYRSIEGFPGYCVGSNGTVWSRLKLIRVPGLKGSRSLIGDEWTRMNPTLGKKCLVVNLYRSGRSYLRKVHHLILEAFIGPRPFGLFGLHRNDNPTDNRLCNVRWGSRLDNASDATRNGRQRRGESHCFSKLTDEQVGEMRRIYAAGGVTHRQLADRYGLGVSTVHFVLTGRSWAHVSSPAIPVRNGKLDQEKADTIRNLVANGSSKSAVAVEYGISRSMVRLIINGGAWVGSKPKPGN